MSVILTKRSFLLGLIATPAVVSINNIMPVKAMQLITDVGSISDLDNYVLVRYSSENIWWMSSAQLRALINQSDYEIVRSTTINQLPSPKPDYSNWKQQDRDGSIRLTTIAKNLQSVEKANVMHDMFELPAILKKPTDRDIAFEMGETLPILGGRKFNV